MYAALSDTKNATNSATSSASPKRPAGTIFLSADSSKSCVMSDLIKPGATAFTVILRGATSCANALVAPIKAALAAE